jgi:RNA polymerase sigma-70 factor, ECF subfamily
MRTHHGHLEPQPGPAAASPAAGPDLAALLSEVAAGEAAAFEAVYDHIAAPVFGIARAVLRDPCQAEEVTQDVLAEIWRTAACYNPARGSPMAWVAVIAHRRAIDRVRAEQASAARQRAAVPPPPGYDEVAETVAASLEAERVRRCLGALTEPQRRAVTLTYYHGYTYRQAAALLGVPDGTLSTRIRDGLIWLRDCLGGQQ